MLVSIVYQSESAIHIPISLLFWISSPFRSPQSFSGVPCAICRLSLVIYSIHSINSVYIYILYVVYMSIVYSVLTFQFFPSSLSPLVFIHLLSMSMSLFLLCIQDHLYHVSRFHSYVLMYDICFFLFLTYFTLYPV